MTDEQKIAMLGELEAYGERHPSLMRAIEARLEDPIEFIMTKLEEDATFQDLLARTDEEVDIATVIKTIVPIVMDTVVKVMGVL